MLSLPGGSDQIAYYRRELSANWRLLVLDTTDLSTHGGWAEGSDKHNEALAYMEAHSDEPQVLRYNGGVGRTQLRWLRDELRRQTHWTPALLQRGAACTQRGRTDAQAP